MAKDFLRHVIIYCVDSKSISKLDEHNKISNHSAQDRCEKLQVECEKWPPAHRHISLDVTHDEIEANSSFRPRPWSGAELVDESFALKMRAEAISKNNDIMQLGDKPLPAHAGRFYSTQKVVRKRWWLFGQN